MKIAIKLFIDGVRIFNISEIQKVLSSNSFNKNECQFSIIVEDYRSGLSDLEKFWEIKSFTNGLSDFVGPKRVLGNFIVMSFSVMGHPKDVDEFVEYLQGFLNKNYNDRKYITWEEGEDLLWR